MAGNLATTPLGSWTLDWHQLTGSPGGWSVSSGALVHAGSDTSGCASDAFAVTPGEVLYVSATGAGSITSGARFRVAFGGSSSFASGDVTSSTDLVDAGTFSATGQEYAGWVTVPAAVTHARLVVYNLAAGSCTWSSIKARRISDLTTPSLKVEVSFGRASNYLNNGILTWKVGAANSDNRVGTSFLCPRAGSSPDLAEWTDITSRVLNATVTRGRRSRTDTFETGQATLLLDDPDRDLDPLNRNAAADYVINGISYVGVGRPVRLSLVDGDTAETYPIFTGRATNWTPKWEGFKGTIAVTAAESIVELNKPIAETSYASQRTDQLLGAILDTLEWPAGLRRIDTGAVTAPAVTVSGSTLTTLRLCATTERGRFYLDGGGNVRLRIGSAYRSSTVQATLTPESTIDLDYRHPAALAFDLDGLRNRVAGTRYGGTPADSQVADDADSIASYGTNGYEVQGLLFQTNAEVRTWCEAILAEYGTPVARVDSIDLEPITNPVLWGLLLWADFGDRFTVEVYPPPAGSDPITQTVTVESVKWTFAQVGQLLDARCTWGLVPVTS